MKNNYFFNFIKRLLLSRFLIDIVNLVLVRILRLKGVLDASYRKSGKFVYIKKNDLFITSYPKSGNTWLRLIVANLYFKNVNYNNIEELVPEIYQTNESKFINNKLRIFKCHDYYDHRFRRAIYIVRDPREVIVSSYFFAIKIGVINKKYSKRKFVKDFLNGKFNSNFGTWNQHVGSWHGAKDQNILFIRYEDLRKRPGREIFKIAKFLKKRMNSKKISKIIRKTSFENLQGQEDKERVNWVSLPNNESKIKFFRSGKINSWKKFLIKKEVKKIEKMWGKNMKIFGYK
tara:strand:- start:32 stop:895 length:864 start_codon:yes stop_codon:yes gene_type:complete